MSQNISHTTDFPLNNAAAIIPTSLEDTPEKVDLIYTVIVDAPDQPRGQFGPVQAWRDEESGEGVWRISVPHSLECIESMKERMDNLVDAEAWKTGDVTSTILAGMVKKNNYSWDSLVQAYCKNDLWAKNVIGMLQETISQTSMLWWCSLPAIESDSAKMIIALSHVDDSRRKELEDSVEKFMIASSVFEEYSDKSHNSSARISAQNQLDHYTENLMDDLGEDLSVVDSYKKVSDDGVVYLSQ